MRSSARKSKYLTPRPYLSWSQFSLFEQNPATYIKRYIFGEQFSSPAMNFGKEIAFGLDQDKTDNPQVEHLRTFLPRYSHTEYQLEAIFKKVPLLGRFDKFDDTDTRRIGEIKTGRTAWTQSKVDSAGQLLFYNLILLAHTGRIADETHLYWAPTEYTEDGQLSLTGEIHTFQAHITLSQVLLFASRIPEVWEGIKKVTKQYYAQII